MKYFFRIKFSIVFFLVMKFHSVDAAVITVTDTLSGFQNALAQSNASIPFDTIKFNIPGNWVHKIFVNSTLTVTRAVYIKGLSQPGSSVGNLKIELLYVNLLFQTASSTVEGIRFDTCYGYALRIDASSNSSSNMRIKKCEFNNCSLAIEVLDGWSTYTNNLFVQLNNFNFCTTGIKINGTSGGTNNPMNYYFEQNNFNNCNKGIYLSGLQALSFFVHANNFNNCYQGVYSQVGGIVLLKINSNYFNFCNAGIKFDDVISASNIYVSVDSNFFDTQNDTAVVMKGSAKYFSHNKVYSFRGVYAYTHGGFNYVDSNIFIPSVGCALAALDGGFSWIRKNSFTVPGNNSEPSIYYYYTTGVEAYENVFNGNDLGPCFKFYEGGLNVRKNTINNYQYGVNTARGNPPDMDSNFISHCGIGIRIGNFSDGPFWHYNFSLRHNEITYSDSDAIKIIFGSDTTVTEYHLEWILVDSNKLVNNGGSGFHLVFLRDSIEEMPEIFHNFEIDKNIILDNDSAGIVLPKREVGDSIIVPLFPIPDITYADYQNGAYYITCSIHYPRPFNNLFLQYYVTDTSINYYGACHNYIGTKMIGTDANGNGIYYDTIPSPYLGSHITVATIHRYEYNTSELSEDYDIAMNGVGVNEIGSASYFTIAPNPCSDCEIRGDFNTADLTVTDILGRKITESLIKTSNGCFINFKNRDSGIFIVRNNKTGQIVKFVKQ